MNKMLKVTFVDPVDIRYMGGGEIWLLKITNLLYQKGYNVRIISFKSNCDVRQKVMEMPEAVDYIHYDGVRFPRGNPLPSIHSMPKFLSELMDTDLIYFYEYPPNEFILYLFKHKIIKPIIAGFHTSLDPNHNLLHAIYYPIFIKALKLFSAYHVMNSYLKKILHYWGFKTVYFIPNGVDTKEFTLYYSSRNSETFNVLFAGRLTLEKGPDILIKIIRYVNEELKIQNIKFIVAGSGPFRSTLKEIMPKYKNVNYLGFVHPKLLPNVYKNAHIFLIPSKTEGMPLSLLEAQSCGLPAIGSNIPGISDVIVNRKTGRLIHPGNIASFAEAIKEYYLLWRHSPEQYYEMSRTIREHIVNNYDWNSIIGKIENMFKETLTNTM
jgi:glycosyltransferase involved in cell wall biosynthesis